MTLQRTRRVRSTTARFGVSSSSTDATTIQYVHSPRPASLTQRHVSDDMHYSEWVAWTHGVIRDHGPVTVSDIHAIMERDGERNDWRYPSLSAVHRHVRFLLDEGYVCVYGVMAPARYVHVKEDNHA